MSPMYHLVIGSVGEFRTSQVNPGKTVFSRWRKDRVLVRGLGDVRNLGGEWNSAARNERAHIQHANMSNKYVPHVFDITCP